MTTRKEYEDLCHEIWHHNRLYYIENNPEISDQEFDHLLKRLEALETKHPDWVTPDSPTQRVGEMLSEGFPTVRHRVPMLSLANTYEREEVEDFIGRVHRLLGRKEIDFTVELKMDGTAVSVLYKNGLYARAVTRGDGKQGDEISRNCKTIPSLPLRLYGKEIPSEIEVRGEVYLEHKRFAKLNQEREEEGEEPWANPRNAAAGSLKLLDPKETARRGLRIVFYGIDNPEEVGVTTQAEVHQKLRTWGLPTLEDTVLCHSEEEIWEFIDRVQEKRGRLAFDIDGVVVKVNDLHKQQLLGSTAKSPRWAVAYKYAAEQAETVIREITVQVGRTGVLTPVAELKPVFLAGSTISRATLHNEEEVARKDIRSGDTVIIEKGGDVIPKVVSVVSEKRPHDSTPWKMPTECPSCGSHVIRVPGEVAVRCPNTTSCPAQLLRSLTYFVSKEAFDIEHLGKKVMEQLVKRGFVQRPSDIFHLSAEQLAELPNFKEKAVRNLQESIVRAKNVSLTRFLIGLGIPYVGSGTAELLASKGGSLQTIMEWNEETLVAIEGIGEKVASAVRQYFSTEENRREIYRLLSSGVVPQSIQVVQWTNHPFAGKTFVLTGALEHFTRTSAAAAIKERGGKVTGSVSKKTDFVLVGEDAGSKLDAGKKLGIPLLSEAQFREML